MSLITPTIPDEYKKAIFVYLDRKPCGTPFYVGVGDAARVGIRKRHRNAHHLAVIEKHDGCRRDIFCIAPTREYANDIEQKLIAHLGRSCNQTGPLANKSAGGDGYVDPSPEVRAARSKAMTGKRWKNPPGANRKAVEASRKVMLGNKFTLGLKLSAEAKAKISATHKGRPKSEAMRLALAKARHERNLRVSRFLEESESLLPKNKVTNGMMDAWFSREGQKCE